MQSKGLSEWSPASIKEKVHKKTGYIAIHLENVNFNNKANKVIVKFRTPDSDLVKEVELDK